MELEKQLTPLPQARRLDELGFKGESYYSYARCFPWPDDTEEETYRLYETSDCSQYVKKSHIFPALSVPELMDALPTEVRWMILQVKKFWNDRYSVWYFPPRYSAAEEHKTNLAEALSDMMIRLIEQGLYIVNKE